MRKSNELTKELEKIIKPIYLVGGSVRDELLGVEPKDFDFCTPHEPEAIEEMVRAAGKKPYKVGAKFGTIGVKLDGTLVEVTTFRHDKYSGKSRKPQVTYVKDITADLSRRDFTMNAIAKRNGKYIDPFGGIEDLANWLIRCVGNTSERFGEDPLRMLRAARFRGQLGFRVDEEIEDRMRKLAHKILNVSKERWVMELDKLLLSDYVEYALILLFDTGLFNYMIPELGLQYEYEQDSPFHDLPLHMHTAYVVKNVPPILEYRWAALLHDIGKPFVRVNKANPDRGTYAKHDLLGAEIVEKTARYLKWPNDRRNKVVELVKNHMSNADPILYNADKKLSRGE